MQLLKRGACIHDVIKKKADTNKSVIGVIVSPCKAHTSVMTETDLRTKLMSAGSYELDTEDVLSPTRMTFMKHSDTVEESIVE